MNPTEPTAAQESALWKQSKPFPRNIHTGNGKLPIGVGYSAKEAEFIVKAHNAAVAKLEAVASEVVAHANRCGHAGSTPMQVYCSATDEIDDLKARYKRACGLLERAARRFDKLAPNQQCGMLVIDGHGKSPCRWCEEAAAEIRAEIGGDPA